MLELIPKELQLLNQWVVTRGGDFKEPLNPRTGNLADVNNPNDWGTYDEATSTGMMIGFVLSANDPYTIIDLDDPFTRKDKSKVLPSDEDYQAAQLISARHAKIMSAFRTYTEVSQSGGGVHIICRGHIPRGVRRDKVEVYSQGRYMICTGNVVSNLAISDHQQLLDVLFQEMDSTGPASDLVEAGDTLTDIQVYRMAAGASNSDKFNRLCCGDITGYPSQSEADLALMTILAFYSRSNEQVRRMFRSSALGKREKAQRDDYLDYALRKIRGKQPPLIDLSQLIRPPVEAPVASATVKPPATGVPFPPGLIGEIAEYVMAAAPRPFREVALGAGITLVSGLIGRYYNISDYGLNQYVIVLAETGTGKEAGAKGIDAILGEVRKTIPVIDQFIGPAEFASGQALLKTIDAQPCFLSILGEVGLTLQQICDPRANSAEKMIRKVLLDIYAKSGFKSVLRPRVYSDKDKNTKMVQAPNVTLLGEGTPGTFYEGLDTSHILEGLIPRFTILEYTGGRSERNRNAGMPPSPDLVCKVAELANIALNMQQNAKCAPVTVTPEALDILDAFDVECDKQINESANPVAKHLWNRGHLKALKMAALVAVGVDPHQPTVTDLIAAWSVEFVRGEVMGVHTRFVSGDVGSGEEKQTADVMRAIEEYGTLTKAQRANYRVPSNLTDKGEVIPWPYLYKRLRPLKSFQSTHRPPKQLLEQALDALIESNEISQFPADQAMSEFKTRVKLYCLNG